MGMGDGSSITLGALLVGLLQGLAANAVAGAAQAFLIGKDDTSPAGLFVRAVDEAYADSCPELNWEYDDGAVTARVALYLQNLNEKSPDLDAEQILHELVGPYFDANAVAVFWRNLQLRIMKKPPLWQCLKGLKDIEWQQRKDLFDASLRALLEERLPPNSKSAIDPTATLRKVLEGQHECLLGWFRDESLARNLLPDDKDVSEEWVFGIHQTMGVWVESRSKSEDSRDRLSPNNALDSASSDGCIEADGFAAERTQGAQVSESWDTTYANGRDESLVVVGDPGFGKTWLLHYEALRAVNAFLQRLAKVDADGQAPPLQEVSSQGEDSQSWLPVFALCRELAARTGFLVECVAAHLKDLLGLNDTEAKVLADYLRTSGMRLFLDSWDEVSQEAQRDELSKALNNWRTSADRRGCVLVSSRPTGLGDPVGLRRLQRWEIRPLTVERCLAIAELWELPQTSKEHIQHELKSSSKLGQMLRVPLVLTASCRIYHNGSENWPANTTELWDSIIENLISQRHRKDDPGSSTSHDLRMAQQVRDLACFIAWLGSGGKEGAWQASYKHECICEQAYQLFGNDPGAIVDHLLSSGLMTARGQEDKRRYEFIHRSFAEFLTARVIAMAVDGIPHRSSASGAQWQTALRDVAWQDVMSSRLWFQREWDEIVVYVGCLATSDAYLTWLLNQDPDPVLHALSIAARIAEQLPNHPITKKVEDAVLEALTPETIRFLPGAVRENLTKTPGLRLTKELLKWITKNSDSFVREKAIEALAGREGDDITDALLEVAAKDSDSSVRKKAIEALAGREGDELVKALRSFSTHLEKNDQQGAFSALAIIELVDALSHGVLSRNNLGGATRHNLFELLSLLWEVAWNQRD
jgi:hypothetical protein